MQFWAAGCVFLIVSVAGDLFSLPPLPYEYDALEPHIDTATMKFHHDKHHAAYVAGLNAASKSGDAAYGSGDADSLASLQAQAVQLGTATRNHGGGHYNHALFWVNLISPSVVTEPSDALKAAIEASFGSLDEFKTAFSKAALGRFGSGWVWLGVTPGGALAITDTANQDNPLMRGLEYPVTPMIPILGLDVWEHAYYLKYQNKRADYVSAFWNVVNWKIVSTSFEKYAVEQKPVPATTSGSSHASEL